jgi:hypothetical protein
MNINVDINKLVEQLKDYAGPLAQHGWEILVRQQYIQGIQEMIWAVALLLFVVVGYIFGKKLWKWAGTVRLGTEDQGIQYIPAVITWVVSVILVFVSVGLISDGIAHLLNPEYYAVQQIYCSAPGVHCNSN